jgi:hypothetical protein
MDGSGRGRNVRLTIAEVSSHFSVTIVRSEDPRPLRPRIIPASRSWRSRQQLKVDHRLGTMTHGSANTIVTSISSADDDDVFTFGVDVPAFFELGVEESLGVQLWGGVVNIENR